MKLTTVLIIIAAVFSMNTASGQNIETDWNGVKLTPTGANEINGVSVFYKQASCSGKDVILVKFVNHNDYAVQAEWFNAIFTKEKQWIKNNNPDQLQNIVISGNATVSGDCNDNEGLVIALSQFTEKSNYQLYKTDQLVITTQ